MFEEKYALYGNNACVVYSIPWYKTAARAELWKNRELIDSESWSAEEGIPNAGFYQESAAFIDAIRKGVSPRPTAEDAIESVSLAEAVEEGKDWHSSGASA
jgi:predicted dehydrogenase